MVARTRRRRLVRAGKALARNAQDRALRAQIEAQLPHARPRGQITVTVKNGFVVLRGFVRSFREKIRLHLFVMHLPHVRALKDLLRVRPVESLADRQVALHARQALDAHSEIPRGTVAVHVTGGTCVLRGHVRTADERHVAEMVASNCRGVRAVVNELTVDPLDELPDAATTQAVRAALAYCKDFATEGISVSCNDGHVALRGRVPTLMDRSLAEEITRLQPGVCSVESYIQIAPRRRRS